MFFLELKLFPNYALLNQQPIIESLLFFQNVQPVLTTSNQHNNLQGTQFLYGDV